MAKAAFPVASWSSRWQRRGARGGTDWADLGTAFGLEMSMRPPGDVEPPQAAAAPPVAKGRRWWQRLGGRPGGSGR
jgi:hypothetical protein